MRPILKGEDTMKRFLTLCLMVFAVFLSLHGCGSSGEVIDYDLVFVNDSDFTVVTVVASFEDRLSGVRNADSSPLKRGESFGFEAGEYPVTLAVYDRTIDSMEMEPGAVAQMVIPKAPPEGERWYVTAHNSGSGLTFTVDTSLPEGV